MSDATHTQGPWTVSQPSGNYIDTPTGSVAALTYGATKADAHLIAAAPDLLAALYEVLSLCDRDSDIGRVVIAAINKAKGY